MPRIERTSLLVALRQHLFDRLRERRVSVEDLQLHHQEAGARLWKPKMVAIAGWLSEASTRASRPKRASRSGSAATWSAAS